MKNLHDRLRSRGASALTDEELLALLIEAEGDNRDPQSVARQLIAACGSIAEIAHTELSRLRMTEGLGLRRAERLTVAAEFGRRVARATARDVECITSDGDVAQLMRPIFDGLSHEECWALYLTSSNRIIERQRVSQGGVQATVVDHRLIVKRALELLSTQIILVHNHPSGAASPSDADKVLTRKIKEAAALFDIQLLDHIIISSEGHFSLRREGMM
ncbi:MAG: DNA repair protein RadC [Alistipes sp.]|nr:DNA repair protein RadC [Alistipes sp.]